MVGMMTWASYGGDRQALAWAGLLLPFSLLGFAPSRSHVVAQLESEEELWVPSMVNLTMGSRAEARRGPGPGE